MSVTQWAKVLEQLLLLVLIVGRWLLPRGELSRDEKSQLLLSYFGTAADIIELFEAFAEREVMTNSLLTFIILGMWSLSLLQFCFVVTAVKARKSRVAFHKSNDKREERFSKACCGCNTDILAIIVQTMLQDGPFLALRITLIFRFNVLSYMNIFFTCKNSLVILLQIYRIGAICMEKGEEDDEGEGQQVALTEPPRQNAKPKKAHANYTDSC